MAGLKIQSKFRGCLLGSLMGDCLGAPYEENVISSGDRIIIQRYFDRMEDPNFKGPFQKHTDDTAMMKSVAQFLIDKPGPDVGPLAKLFVDEYFKDSRRNYGSNVIDVFAKLRNSNCEDVFRPAKEQFGGLGSYGNGSAMRIAPVALYFYDDYENMIRVATDSSKITHTNLLGINGALLQCIAVQQAFLADPEKLINIEEFCTSLIEKIGKIEDGCYKDTDADNTPTPYCAKLKQMQILLGENNSDELDDEVIRTLGNGIAAYESVPTAIYCFLRAQKEIPRIETNNIIRRTIQYAITLGGDTDTIAGMAGSIAGAHLGEESINKDILSHCEKYNNSIELSDNLYQAKMGS